MGWLKAVLWADQSVNTGRLYMLRFLVSFLSSCLEPLQYYTRNRSILVLTIRPFACVFGIGQISHLPNVRRAEAV